jgi:1-acyl-sn-glycerol-3-phosphate acyltransferase
MRVAMQIMRALVQSAYGAYAYLMFISLGLAALAAMLVVPGVARRRVIARAAARLFLSVVGMRLAVKGLERLPAGQSVVVANHASYLDGLVLTAALPPRFGFVIKREMAGVPLAASMLHRIGAEFVERFDRNKGAADARRVLRKTVAGQSMVFFPEGTFSPQPGLLKFHAGAFIAAARAGCPIVPAAVRGTRQALPPGRLLPKAGPITVELLPVVETSTADSGMAASELRERAREAILHHLSERDLATA